MDARSDRAHNAKGYEWDYWIVGLQQPEDKQHSDERAHTSSLDIDLTCNTRAPHFTPQHWLLCHMGLYWTT